jgi:AcrR family transcriptional regulator
VATPDSEVSEAERARRSTHPTARRLVVAAREVLITRGLAGTTWEAVERAAEVSTGTLRYYFGNKERMLEEVLRADSDARVAQLRARVEPALSVEEIEQALADILELLLTGGGFVVLQELGTPSLRDEGLRRARDELRTRFRDALAELLERKAEQGVVALPATPAAVAGLLAIIGQGVGAEATSSPTWDPAPTIQLARRAARQLLTPANPPPHPAAAAAPSAASR